MAPQTGVLLTRLGLALFGDLVMRDEMQSSPSNVDCFNGCPLFIASKRGSETSVKLYLRITPWGHQMSFHQSACAAPALARLVGCNISPPITNQLLRRLS